MVASVDRASVPGVYMDGVHMDLVGGDRTVTLFVGEGEDGPLEVLRFCLSRAEECAALLAAPLAAGRSLGG